MKNPIQLTKVYDSPVTKAWRWLLTTLSLLGIFLITFFAYFVFNGLPSWLLDFDARVTRAKLETLRAEFDQTQSATVELLSWKQDTQTMQKRKADREVARAEAEKVRLARK